MEKQLPFFSVDVQQTRLEFDDIAAIKVWCDKESLFWRWFINGGAALGGQISELRNRYAKWFALLNAALTEWIANPASDQLKTQVHNRIQNFLSPNDTVLSNHPFALIAEDAARRYGDSAGAAALACLLGKPCEINFDSARGIAHAVVARDGVSADKPNIIVKAIERINAENAELQAKRNQTWLDLSKRSDEHLSTSAQQLQEQTGKIDREWEEISVRNNREVEASIKRITDTDALFREQMKLQAPVGVSDAADVLSVLGEIHVVSAVLG